MERSFVTKVLVIKGLVGTRQFQTGRLYLNAHLYFCHMCESASKACNKERGKVGAFSEYGKCQSTLMSILEDSSQRPAVFCHCCYDSIITNRKGRSV